MSSNKAMRREAFFSGDSPYEVLVSGNVLLHRQAAQKVAGRLRGVVHTRPGDAPFRVLDLACGGIPTTMTTVMERFPERRFRYTGVDINKEQVAKAKRFRFPDNVDATCLEGSAWDVRPLRPRAPFDLIFVGLNWHHGTPEELWFMARHARDLLAEGGRLINHDCYRPDSAPHVTRPESVDADGARCALALVDPDLLAAAKIPRLGIESLPAGTEAAWRSDLIARLARGYREHGGDERGAGVLTAHSAGRDYPVSVADACRILESVGFQAEAERYEQTDGPLADYLAVVTAWQRPQEESRA